MMNNTIRDYTPDDLQEVMHILDLNTPAYFAPEEAADLEHYLSQEREQYFVALSDTGAVIGAGGINYDRDQGLAKISWDLVHPEWQGKGIGTQLLQHRINILLRDWNGAIIVRTSQMAYPFYEKNGFILEEIARDYWAPGFDLYRMMYKKH